MEAAVGRRRCGRRSARPQVQGPAGAAVGGRRLELAAATSGRRCRRRPTGPQVQGEAQAAADDRIAPV
jgi:hypothetical protein